MSRVPPSFGLPTTSCTALSLPNAPGIAYTAGIGVAGGGGSAPSNVVGAAMFCVVVVWIVVVGYNVACSTSAGLA